MAVIVATTALFFHCSATIIILCDNILQIALRKSQSGQRFSVMWMHHDHQVRLMALLLQNRLCTACGNVPCNRLAIHSIIMITYHDIAASLLSTFAMHGIIMIACCSSPNHSSCFCNSRYHCNCFHNPQNHHDCCCCSMWILAIAVAKCGIIAITFADYGNLCTCCHNSQYHCNCF